MQDSNLQKTKQSSFLQKQLYTSPTNKELTFFFQWQNAFNKGDFMHLEQLLSDNVQIDIPCGKTLNGKQEALELFKSLHKDGYREKCHDIQERYYGDGTGYSRCVIDLCTEDMMDEVVQRVRDVLYLKQNSEGMWQIEYNIYNFSVCI